MKKILYFLALIIVVASCTSNRSSGERLEDYNFGYMMSEFYLKNLRYPRSTNDYCERMFKHDSLNNFAFVRLLSRNPNITFKTWREYADFVDNIYSSSNGFIFYSSWKMYYNSQSVIECTDGKIIIDNKDDGNKYYYDDIKPLLYDYVKGKRQVEDFRFNDMLTIRQLMGVRIYSKDSIFVELPDSVFSPQKVRNGLTPIIFSIVDNIHKETPEKRLYNHAIRYHRDGKMESAEKDWLLPEEFKHSKELVHYLDSCVRIDKRIGFIQFYSMVEINSDDEK